MNEQEIIDLLRREGHPEHVWRGGGKGLIARWREFVKEVESGYELGLEDYRNELDVRALIAKLNLGDEAQPADQRFARLLTAREKRIWETHPDGFWNFGYPANAKGELLADLQADGVM